MIQTTNPAAIGTDGLGSRMNEIPPTPYDLKVKRTELPVFENSTTPPAQRLNRGGRNVR